VPDLSLQEILLRIVALLVIAPVHGAALAGLARALGDRGPGHDGRLTANPVAHVDVAGALALVLGRAGWIRPVALAPEALRGGRAGLVAVALGALGLTLLLVPIAAALESPALVLTGSAGASEAALLALDAIADATVWFVALNVVPVPPLTGGYLLQAVAPGAFAWLARQRVAVAAVLLALALLGLLEQALAPLARALASSL
jgi:Zn-dependent protease